jgi:hypothetical protein
LDVLYETEDDEARKADVIVPQKIGVIRHLGEKVADTSVFSIKELRRWIKPLKSKK